MQAIISLFLFIILFLIKIFFLFLKELAESEEDNYKRNYRDDILKVEV